MCIILVLYVSILIIIYIYINNSESFDCSNNMNYMRLFNSSNNLPLLINQEPIYLGNDYDKIYKYKPHKASLFTSLNPFQKIFRNIDPKNPSLKNIIKSIINA